MPRLSSILVLVAFGSVMLPGVLGMAIMTLTQGRISEGPIVRALVASREVPRAVEPGRDGGLVRRPGYASPAWLDLVVADEEGVIVFSTMPSEVPGSRASLGAIAARAEGIVPRGTFIADIVEMGGRRLGTWYAILPSDAARSLAGETGPLFRLTGAALFAGFAFLFCVAVAAALASQMRRLERAAIAIAAGDLETPVSARGSREIVALAEAMERMRASIREDQGRRSRFLAAVSHDLRTPITAIGGYLEAVEDGLAADPATLVRYVAIMKEKTALLEDRIDGLIEFARMETGEWRLRFEPVALGPLFASFARSAAEECTLAGSRLEADLDALEGLEADADAALLGRAFENLVSNGLRYGKAGGTIRVGARFDPPGTVVGINISGGSGSGVGVTIHGGQGRGAPEGHGVLHIDVDDEGPGIPSAERELAFEAFWRGRAARDGEGSGLGLHIARSIARGHGWDLVAGNAPGGGARLSLVIPPGSIRIPPSRAKMPQV